MYAIDYSNYLQHHGILGMKWGVRRYQNADGSLTSAGKRRYNENYKPDQIRRDIAVYGKHGAKRISKDMDHGIPISGARSLEAARYHKAENASNTGRKIGKVVGALGGVVLGASAAYGLSRTEKGKDICLNIVMAFSKKHRVKNYVNVQSFLKSRKGTAIVATGASIVGALIGATVGKNAPLAAKGYTSLARHDMKVGYTEKTTRDKRDKKADKAMRKMGY